MASSTTEFGIEAIVLTLLGTSYCVSDMTQTTSADGFQYTCMDSRIQKAAVSGIYEWGVSANLVYDNDGDIDSLRGGSGTYSLVITTSNAKTITQTGNIVITGVGASFSHGDLSIANVTMIGNGAFLEVNS